MKSQTKLICVFVSILLIVLFLWGSMAYVFFADNTWENHCNTDVIELNQYVDFLNEKSDNIENYVNRLIINDKLQKFLKDIESIQDISEKNSYISHFFRGFADEINIDTAVQSMVLVSPENHTYWSRYPYTNEFKAYWDMISADNTENASYYSEPYEIFFGFTEDYIVSYVSEVRDLENPSEKIGYLVINVYFEYWSRICDRMRDYYDGILWKFGDALLYEAGMNGQKAVKENKTEDKTDVCVYSDKSYSLTRRIPERTWEITIFREYKNIIDVKKYLFMFAVFFISNGIVVVLILLFLSKYLYARPVYRLVKNMGYIMEGKFNYSYKPETSADMEYLESNLHQMASRLDVLVKERVENEKNIKNLEIEVLLLQINPHFIYNTLNTVIYLARKEKCASIEQLMKSFVVLLRNVLPSKEQNEIFVTVEREISVVKHYCVVQNYRYPDMIELNVMADTQVRQKRMPKAILQPLVENAILHGIFPSEKRGAIDIKIENTDEKLRIEVRNDGVSIEADVVEQIYQNKPLIKSGRTVRSIGIENICQRLSFYYKEYTFDIEAVESGGTRIVITFPEEPIIDRV